MAVLLTASPQQCSEKVIDPISDAVSWFLYCVADVYKCSISKRTETCIKVNLLICKCLILFSFPV